MPFFIFLPSSSSSSTPSGPYTVTINGVDRTGDILNASIAIEDIINDRVNSCTFKMVNLSGSGFPSVDQEVIITIPTGDVLFGGYITSMNLAERQSAG